MATGVHYLIRAPRAFHDFLVRDFPFPPAEAFNLKRGLNSRGLVVTGLARAADIASGETDYEAIEVG